MSGPGRLSCADCSAGSTRRRDGITRDYGTIPGFMNLSDGEAIYLARQAELLEPKRLSGEAEDIMKKLIAGMPEMPKGNQK